jgi:Domain of unknown function (DUF202)
MSEPAPRHPADGIPDDIEDADPGAARARTSLAWTRSAISFAALGAVILKSRPGIGVPILIFSAVIFWIGNLPAHWAPAPRRMLLVTIAVTVTALLGLVLTLVGPPAHGIRL